MKKLTKVQLEARTNLIEKLKEAGKVLEDNSVSYNEAATAFMELIDEAKEWAQEVVDAAEEFWEGRSEKWQESEKGLAYQEWKSAYQSVIDNLSSVDEVTVIDTSEDTELLDELAAEPEEV